MKTTSPRPLSVVRADPVTERLEACEVARSWLSGALLELILQTRDPERAVRLVKQIAERTRVMLEVAEDIARRPR